MGCASSLPPEYSEFPGVAVADTNGNATGSKSSVVANGQGKEVEDRKKDKLRGDVVMRYEAKKERQKKLLEKQKKVATAAEELSSQVMDEKEMLSLTSRSRGTSRATSRAASPVTSRKQNAFKSPVPETTSEGGEKGETTSPACENGHVRAMS